MCHVQMSTMFWKAFAIAEWHYPCRYFEGVSPFAGDIYAISLSEQFALLSIFCIVCN